MKKTTLLLVLISSNLLAQINPGAYQVDKYLSIINNKKIAIVANQSSEINGVSLVDSLLNLNQQIFKVFSPEHGFRGKADAGEKVNNQIDIKTGLEIISLYGKNKKPNKEQLQGLEYIIFDLQDVGVRFYTYISTLHYVMEACAENNISLIVLDRPNPNISYIDGPVLDMEYTSFVGMHPVPIVYGMTIGEYAKMINGEKWLKNGVQCKLEIIEIENYTRISEYILPVKPSPNLPNPQSIALYPSLCLFEGSTVSVGRGTDMQFQIYGSPEFKYKYDFSFIPKPNEGAKNPKHIDRICYGKDLREYEFTEKIELEWLIDSYNKSSNKEGFFNKFFTKLAGTEDLETDIKKGLSHKEIKKSWEKDLTIFKNIRSNYLIYK